MNSIQFDFSKGLKCFYLIMGHPTFFFSICLPVIGAFTLFKKPTNKRTNTQANKRNNNPAIRNRFKKLNYCYL